jgi:hypothetical protein
MREATRLRRELVEDFPKMHYGHCALSDGLHALARLVVTTRGDDTEARRLLEQAVAQMKTALKLAPGTEPYLGSLRDQYGDLAELLIRIDEPGDAAKAAAELPALFPGGPSGHLRAGRFFARRAASVEKAASLPEAKRLQVAQAWADWAMPFLREAIREGQMDINHLKDSPELEEDAKQRLSDWVEKAKQMKGN